MHPDTTLAVTAGLAFAIGALWKLNSLASSRFDRIFRDLQNIDLPSRADILSGKVAVSRSALRKELQDFASILSAASCTRRSPLATYRCWCLRPTRPGRDHSACALDNGDQRGDVIRLQAWLDDHVHEARGKRAIAIAIAAVTGDRTDVSKRARTSCCLPLANRPGWVDVSTASDSFAHGLVFKVVVCWEARGAYAYASRSTRTARRERLIDEA